MKSKGKYKNTLRQMIMKTQPSKIYGYSKSSSKREVHRETPSSKKKKKKDKKMRNFKQPKPPPKGIRKRRANLKSVGGSKK